jgi:diguanylate cyclase (GGDEF)-like protein
MLTSPPEVDRRANGELDSGSGHTRPINDLMESYAGISLRGIRELAATGWAAGIVIACVLMIPAPPTVQLGAWGWVAGIGVQALSVTGLLLFRRYRARIGFGALLAVTWALPIDLGIMQWLAGGRDAPYHELLLPALILGSAGLPPRRFAPFAVAVALIALAPALYAPDADGLLGMLAELAVWMFVAIALSLLMVRIRGQARLARSDQLTRLANRRALDELFALPRTGELVLAIGDLNAFKQINDRHGHLAGDACLIAVADVLASEARAGDQVFRWGGDEFAVLLPGATAGDAEAALARLEAAVRDRVHDPDGDAVQITFGWAAGGPETDLRTLIAQADAALLARKPSRLRA